jgi:hypothetical protein
VSATSTQKSFFYSKNQNHVACIWPKMGPVQNA